jgi:hypothetical protein
VKDTDNVEDAVMRDTLGNIWYFGTRLFALGLWLGLIFGSFAYPLVGSMVGIVWGGIAGLVLGLGTGIGVSIYNRFFVKPETDFETYQHDLAYGVGLVTLIVSAIPLLVVFAPVAALASAYVAHTYAEKQLPQTEKRKNENREVLREGVVAQMVKRTLSKAPIFVFLAAISGMLYILWGMTHTSWTTYTTSELVTQSILLSIGITIYGFILTAVVGLTNGMFIHFLNHLYFKPDMPKRDYKRQVVPFVTVLTLLMTIVAAGFFGAPLAAIAAGWGANAYVDWYYEGQEKTKRDARYLHHLADESEDEEEIVSAEEAYLWNEAD